MIPFPGAGMRFRTLAGAVLCNPPAEVIWSVRPQNHRFWWVLKKYTARKRRGPNPYTIRASSLHSECGTKLRNCTQWFSTDWRFILRCVAGLGGELKFVVSQVSEAKPGALIHLGWQDGAGRRQNGWECYPTHAQKTRMNGAPESWLGHPPMFFRRCFPFRSIWTSDLPRSPLDGRQECAVFSSCRSSRGTHAATSRSAPGNSGHADFESHCK